MHCPFCGHAETKVNDSRLAGEGRQIRRRRECLACGERFTTFETAELLMPVIVKSNRTREPFDEGKLKSGMGKALEKRPVSRESLEEAVSRIVHKLRALGEREVSSRAVGELVMDELRQLDEVAYVRFASVYRSFQDLDAFREEIERLRRHGRRREMSREQLPLLPGAASAGVSADPGGASSAGAADGAPAGGPRQPERRK
jgi:transcriptional repressor NrdR